LPEGHAQKLVQAINGEDLDTPVHAGFDLDELVEGDSVLFVIRRTIRPGYGPMLA
jgi:hypothetical protein